MLEAIERLLMNAKPIPLTDQVRVDMQELMGLVDELRVAVYAERSERKGD